MGVKEGMRNPNQLSPVFVFSSTTTTFYKVLRKCLSTKLSPMSLAPLLPILGRHIHACRTKTEREGKRKVEVLSRPSIFASSKCVVL